MVSVLREIHTEEEEEIEKYSQFISIRIDLCFNWNYGTNNIDYLLYVVRKYSLSYSTTIYN